MITARSYKDVEELLEEHGCRVVPVSSMYVHFLNVTAMNGMDLFLYFHEDEQIYGAKLMKDGLTLVRIKGIDHIYEWCGEVTFCNVHNQEIASVAVESSD